MKKFILFLLLAKISFGAFSVCVPVTINHLKVANTDQTDFTIPVCANGDSGKYCDATAFSNLASTSFKQLASGGKSLNASGFDINWFSDNACTSSLPFFFVPATYTGTTGYGKWYVKKTVLTASDVIIYAGIGNASITTDQSSNAWASTFKAVWPFSGLADFVGPTVAGVRVDATGNGFNLTIGSTAATPKAPNIDLDGVVIQPGANGGGNTNDQGAHVLASGLPIGTSDRTLIFYESSITSSNGGYIFGYGVHGQFFAVANGSSATTNSCGTGNAFGKRNISFRCGGSPDLNTTTQYCQQQGDTGLWTMHQIGFVLSSTGAVIDAYVDGVLDSHSTGGACNTVITGNGTFLAWNSEGDCATFSNCFFGDPSQTFMYGKIADSVLSADYIATENNAVSSPQTFLTFGTPLVLGGGNSSCAGDVCSSPGGFVN